MASPKKKWLARKALENTSPAVVTEPVVLPAPKVAKAAPPAAKKTKKPVNRFLKP